MAKKCYFATSLTGGSVGALDEIDGSELNDTDAAFVITASQYYIYVLDADSAAAGSSPATISPDSNAGDKRWVRVTATTISTLGSRQATLDADDATPNVTNIDIGYANNSSTITVTDFDQDTATSQYFTYVANRATVIAHDVTKIRLIGGINLMMANLDKITFLYNVNNNIWEEVSRSIY